MTAERMFDFLAQWQNVSKFFWAIFPNVSVEIRKSLYKVENTLVLSIALSLSRSLSVYSNAMMIIQNINFFLFISLLNLDNLVCHLGQGPKDKSASKRDTTNEKLSKRERERATDSLCAREERVRVRAGAGECVCLHRIHNYTI